KPAPRGDPSCGPASSPAGASHTVLRAAHALPPATLRPCLPVHRQSQSDPHPGARVPLSRLRGQSECLHPLLGMKAVMAIFDAKARKERKRERKSEARNRCRTEAGTFLPFSRFRSEGSPLGHFASKCRSASPYSRIPYGCEERVRELVDF